MSFYERRIIVPRFGLLLVGVLCLLRSTITTSDVSMLDKLVNDHIECDINTLDLSAEHRQMVDAAFASPRLHSQQVLDDAALTHWNITPHTVYRYLASGGWSGTYNGKAIVDAVVETAHWRKQFKIHLLDGEKYLPVLEKQVAYVNGADRDGRSLLYFKIGNIRTRVDSETMIRVLMYSVERADRDCTARGSGSGSGSGQFVAVIDLQGMAFSTAPSLGVIKTALGLLKHNYPYRLHSLLIINAGPLFSTLWSWVRPLMPARALAKTHLLSKHDTHQALLERIGSENLETTYGGEMAPVTDFGAYVRRGYWYQVTHTAAVAEDEQDEAVALQELDDEQEEGGVRRRVAKEL